MALSVSAVPAAGFTVLAVSGEIDLQTAPELSAAVDSQLAAGATRLAVDLNGVDFLDSSALGALVGINKRLSRDDGLVVVCAKPSLLRLFELTKLTQAFTIVASVDDLRS